VTATIAPAAEPLDAYLAFIEEVVAARVAETVCETCHGEGVVYALPRGAHYFHPADPACPLPDEFTCHECGGTGERP